jgi:two-component sensor histidine kinase
MASNERENTLRLRHRTLLADLGTTALRGRELDPLLNEAARLVAEGMGTQFCKILEYRPEKGTLLVRAGIGWREGVVGNLELEADTGSPAGYALQTGLPVISNNLSAETRFRTPQLLLDHGIERAMNVIIRGDGRPFGVLEADSQRGGVFVEDDIAFMQAAANLLGVAIERGRRENELRDALDMQKVLRQEADHRIKNSLQLVVSLLTLQQSRVTAPEAAEALVGAIARVRAIAEAHRALQQSTDQSAVSLGGMLQHLCEQITQLDPLIEVRCRADEDIKLDTDRAIPLALIVTELLTNASRHAYPEDHSGMVEAEARIIDDTLQITVTDRGVGIGARGTEPEGTLGTSIVHALARQVGAEINVSSGAGQGTTVQVRLPTIPPRRG